MLRFSEEIMLLLLDDKGGRFVDVPTLSLEYALAGAALMDLAMEGRIDTDPERLFVVDPTPLGDDLLDPALARIVASDESHDARYWIKQTAADAEDIRERSLARLVDRGILHREEDRFMWVLRTRRYPIDDYKAVREVKLRIMGVILSEDIPEARDSHHLARRRLPHLRRPAVRPGTEGGGAADRPDPPDGPDRPGSLEGGDGNRNVPRHGFRSDALRRGRSNRRNIRRADAAGARQTAYSEIRCAWPLGAPGPKPWAVQWRSGA